MDKSVCKPSYEETIMNGATVFVLAILGIGIYAIAKQRGERKKAMPAH